MNGESGCRKQTHFVPGCCKVQHLNMLPYCPFSSPHFEPNTRFLYLCFPCSLHPFFLCGCDRLLNYFKPLWTTTLKTLHITANQVDQTWEYRTLESHAGIKMRQGGKCPLSLVDLTSMSSQTFFKFLLVVHSVSHNGHRYHPDTQPTVPVWVVSHLFTPWFLWLASLTWLTWGHYCAALR